MYHYTYMTVDENSGKYYVGRHSTENLFDGYKGSGKWVRNYPKTKRSDLITYVLEFFNDASELKCGEQNLLNEFHAQPHVSALHAKLVKRMAGGNAAYKKLDEATKTPFELGDHHGYNNTDPLVRRQAMAKYKEGSAEHGEYKKGVAAGNERRSSIGKQYRA